jgi:hypothetical protein
MTTAARSLRALALVTALGIGATAPAALADSHEVPFSQTELYFELNDTDGDLGIHAAIDGEAWKSLGIWDPKDQQILGMRPLGRLAKQGLTQLFFESAEPNFEDLAPEVFFRRFPEGTYEIEGVTLDGRELEGEVRLSQVLAAPAEGIEVNGQPAAESCDADDLPVVSEPVTIRWDPVTESHPEIGRPGTIEVERYQFFVEREGAKVAYDLPPDVTEVLVPSEILGDPGEHKFEIIVRTGTGNNTAVESCFVLE